ncbi:hypothetical protein J2Y88_003054 [Pseudomonas chlororaphis]|uniref:hypothetical protein n=1 Tax=Pseudomonas chlororaphis TaxID=587753 RepID=UPI00209FB774|nr:hypothetical protein [Pseudomonas chlororaphis]MCP1480743.1 hypothetical protein [Pseudomonas chlororaphis]MCP1592905.1 hypothetical protein [Pseudomonas chlororaphis]
MMAKSFWYSWLGLVLVASPLLLCVINLSFSYYLSRRYLKEMLEALQRSQHFYRWTDSLPYEGWFTHFVMLAAVRGSMLWPGPAVRRGFLSSEDIDNFPPHLQRLLTIRNWMDVVLLVWGSIMYALLKLTKH